jgi:hypothetical protein
MKRIFILSVFALSLLVFAVSCHNGDKQSKDEQLSSDVVKNPNTANGDADTSRLPMFSFTDEVHDFGRIIQGEKVSYSFKFKNVGKSDLVITDANGSCGCTIADYPKTAIAPNGEGSIDVTFNSEGKKGYQSKTVTIVANTQPNTKVLTIKAQIQIPEGDSDE